MKAGHGAAIAAVSRFVYPYEVNPQGPGMVLIVAPGLFVGGLGVALLTYAVWSWVTGRS